jgi:hypothetical protein
VIRLFEEAMGVDLAVGVISRWNSLFVRYFFWLRSFVVAGIVLRPLCFGVWIKKSPAR